VADPERVDAGEQQDEAQFEAGLIEALRDRLAAFKVPKRICFIAALPRNAMGKVQKNQLREAYASLLQAAVHDGQHSAGDTNALQSGS
jgi:malonyl-CoA/methylmalonyl-CoA synthetase